jgi:hypothetical protein
MILLIGYYGKLMAIFLIPMGFRFVTLLSRSVFVIDLTPGPFPAREGGPGFAWTSFA